MKKDDGGAESGSVTREAVLEALFRAARDAEEKGEYEKAARLLNDVLAHPAAAEDENVLLLALLRLGEVLHLEGTPSSLRKAVDVLEEFVELSRRLSFSEGLADGLVRLAWVHSSLGAYDKAWEAAREAVELLGDTDRRPALVSAMGLAGQIARRSGRLDDALAMALDGLAAAQKDGMLGEELAFMSDLVLISLEKKDWDAAYKEAAVGLRKARNSGRMESVPVFLGQMARALEGMGRYDEARERLEEGLQEAEKVGDKARMAAFLEDLSRYVHLQDGDPAKAVSLLMRSYALLEGRDYRRAMSILTRSAFLMAEFGDYEAAFKALADVLVLAAAGDSEAFESWFSSLFKLLTIPWKDGAYEAMERGVEQMREYFLQVDKGGGEEERAARPLLDMLAKCMEALREWAASRGDRGAPSAARALEIAQEVDGALSLGLVRFLEEGWVHAERTRRRNDSA